MPSSLIFAALAAAWLVVLVPMIAKRRQEVVRTADSALASRVIRRPEPSHHGEEVARMTERTARPATREHDVAPDAAERRFRPGRGGYDPEAAALAARARYAFRQRVVVGLLLAAVVTLVLALAVSTTYWWFHAAFDVAAVGYLGYLRRQVRIEEEVRHRRAVRLGAPRRRPAEHSAREEYVGDDGVRDDGVYRDAVHGDEHRAEDDEADAPPPAPEPVVRTAPPAVVHPRAVAVDLDDEDPVFDELDPSFEPPYRRAAGE